MAPPFWKTVWPLSTKANCLIYHPVIPLLSIKPSKISAYTPPRNMYKNVIYNNQILAAVEPINCPISKQWPVVEQGNKNKNKTKNYCYRKQRKKFHRHNIQQTEPNTEECKLYHSVHIILKKQNIFIWIEARVVISTGIR